VREIRSLGSMRRDVETESWRLDCGTAIRKGRQQLRGAYRHRATSRPYERLAHDTSAWCKLSGLLTEAGKRRSAAELTPFVADVFSCFGPERVVWGSDWPVLNLVSSYPEWLDLSRGFLERLAPSHAAGVFGGNARRLYRLDLH
jgi:L-fuconolactonase